MSLNGGDYGNILGGVISIYSPQAGQAVGGLFQRPTTLAAAPPPVVLAAPVAPKSRVGMYALIGGGVVVAGILVVVLFRLAK